MNTSLNLDQVIDEAFAAAAKATTAMIDENPGVWYPCGFAWVNIKPARGKLVNLMKEKKLGKTDDYLGGFTVYNPSKNPTQWMDAKATGARAFADVLKKYGFNARVHTRID